MLPDKLHEAVDALTRAEHLLTILYDRIERTVQDQPCEELTLTIRDSLSHVKEKLLEEERKLHTP